MRFTIIRNSLLMICLISSNVFSQDWKLLYGLRGDWKFEVGDDKRSAETKFDDSKWETIYAPSKWEDEGFPGYDGYAWYRKHFKADSDWKGKAIFLRLGHIDDVDEVFVNGRLVGRTGEFPPGYETAYNVERNYEIPLSFLNIPGDNVIAVRVYDDELGGGIADGKLGVYEDRNALIPEIPLAGEWKFKTGDDPLWKEKVVSSEKKSGGSSSTGKSTNNDAWDAIRVPGNWEYQGYGVSGSTEYEGYDGYAWYRIHFFVPKEFADKRLILVLGKIDDFDETFVNGTLVGKTGKMGTDVRNSNDWQKLRAYTLLPGQLLPGEDNVIAVRVFDGWRGGGIYSGPIGIVSRERFLKWQGKNHDGETVLDWIFR
jgi:hypothetical protein